MTSKERTSISLSHREPDRVPVGEWGVDHDHVSNILGRETFWRNRRECTLAYWEGRRDEAVEGMKKDYAELVERLDYDVIPVELVPPKGFEPIDPPKKVADNLWRDSSGAEFAYAASNDSIVRVSGAPEGKFELSDNELSEYSEKLLEIDETVFEVLDFIAAEYAGERAVVFRDMNIYSSIMAPFGGDESHELMLTAMAPEQIKQLIPTAVEYNRRLLEYCADRGVFAVMQGKDFGSNIGPMMSPESIKELYFPAIAEISKMASKHGLHHFFHCCGNIWSLLDYFVEAGCEAYQSIQATATMDWKKIKDTYGDKLSLWTGVQCETLIEGAPEDVENEVKSACADLMPGGGFIFGSTNSVQFGAKTDNYLRALDTVRRYGVYS